MAACVTCGDELHPERAEKYDYCTRRGCREQNAEGLRMVAVGVNKAADQYVLLTDRTERDMAGGRFKKQPEVPSSGARRRNRTGSRPSPVPKRRRSPTRRPQWSRAQENLAVLYRSMGQNPEEIAKKLGMSVRLVTQILLRRSPV